MSSIHLNDTVGPEVRIIELNRGLPAPDSLFPKNLISTGKYSLLSFLPKNLFEQFHRIANIWFLIVSIFQVLPLNLSPTSSWATIAPLSLVLTVTLMKDGYQDYKRHSMDKHLNSKPIKIWAATQEKFLICSWKDIQVGNIVLLEQDSQIPADILAFNSSSSEKSCFVETSSLDGENNLKIKQCVNEIAELMDSNSAEEAMGSISHLDSSVVRSEQPNNRLHNFEGSAKLKGHPRGIPLDIKNMLLRGSTLKNTKWVIGVVIFTGPDTKLAKNLKTPSHKRSRVELKVNKYLIIVFSVLFAIVVLSTSISLAFAYNNEKQQQFFSGSSMSSSLVFITFMILYNSFVPISLYVTMDIVRVLQAKFIQWDLKLTCKSLGYSAMVKNGDLNEELGQIEYIFTDKTGTLTENVMEFKKCSIRGKVYGTDDEITEKYQVNPHDKCNFSDPELMEDLNGINRDDILEYFESLALCNTVITDYSNGEVVYQSASPDEEALVIAAHCMGVSLINTKPSSYTLKINGESLDYKILGINEFSSERKRMSVVIEPSSDKYRPASLLCKGADNAILERSVVQPEMLKKLQLQIEQFAVKGLRILLVAKRDLTEDEARDFERRYNLARNALSDRNKRLEELAEEFERSLEVIGITGIEDKIQTNVPETISAMRSAGLNIWMLTGDKQETAINIGFSTKLLTPDIPLIKLNCKTIEDCKKILKNELSRHIVGKKHRHNSVLNKIRAVSDSFNHLSLNPEPKSNSTYTTRYQIISDSIEAVEGEMKLRDFESIKQSLIVDGQTLGLILADIAAIKYFIILTALCKSVVCCRVTPLQKSEVVRLVKSHLIFKPVTLAIGDGANDVSMIQEAHVGIGLFGKEGMQAANSSDFAIARFSHLLPLLQIHGRWNYSRISRVILYSFYKNFILVLPLFYFSFINMHSGTAYYDSWLMMGYNVFFTALPVIILGSLDQDLPANELLKHTELYQVGIASKLFNAKVFIKWTIKALIHSLIVFSLTPDRKNLTLTSSGFTECSDATGTASFFVLIQIATYEILMEAEYWTILFLLVCFFSLAIFYPVVFMYDSLGLPTKSMIGVPEFIFSTHYFVFILLTPLICLMISLARRYTVSLWLAHDVDNIRRKTVKVMPGSKYHTETPLKKNVISRIKDYSANIEKIFVAKGLRIGNNQDEDKDFYSMYKYFLYFKHNFLERIYRNYLYDKNNKLLKLLIRSLFLVFLGWTIAEYFISSNVSLHVMSSLQLALAGFIVFLTYTARFKQYYELSLIFLVIGSFILKTVQEIFESSDGSMSTSIAILITFTLLDIQTYKMILINTLFLITYLIRASIVLSFKNYDIQTLFILLTYSVLLIGILIISAFTGFNLEKSHRNEFVLKKQLEFQLSKAQAILGYLLPDFVKARVKQGVTYIEEKESVTVLFCDIYNFDLICATHESTELLELLDKLFAVLDQLCEKNGVTKIETVNKTYMICGGLLNETEETHLPAEVRKLNHAERCVETALQILKKLEPVYLKTGNKLQVKIGINSGKVIAGVVGEHKPQFSLVGNTINTAARMCQTLTSPDKIQISSSTYDLISHENYSFVANTIAPKGLDVQETFIVDLVKLRRNKRRELRLEEDSKVFETSFNQLIDQGEEEVKPSFTILLPELDDQQVSMFFSNFELDQLNVTESEGLDLIGSTQWLICSLKETRMQQKFRIVQTKQNLKVTILGLWTSLAVYLLEIIIYIAAYTFLDDFGNSFIILLKVLYVTSMLLLIISLKKLYIKSEFPWVVTLLYILTSFISTISLLTVQPRFYFTIALHVMYTNLIISHIWKLTVSYIVISTVSSASIWLCVVLKSLPLSSAAETSFFVIPFFLINLFANLILEGRSRKAFNLSRFAKKEIRNTEKLLNQMMPPQVLRNLHNDITTTDKHKDATIIYADISGFTSYCKSREPIEVVSMLSKLFSTFDHLCVRHNVYKVHTIGDCYVILSFTDGETRDPFAECMNCIEMALDMIKAIDRVNKNKGISLAMRIGMHTGTIVAGITGTNIVRYDIYGPDNDIANKMESQGIPGRINISEVTKSLLEKQCPERFDYEFNKVVHYSPTDISLEAYFVVPLLESDMTSAQE